MWQNTTKTLLEKIFALWFLKKSEVWHYQQLKKDVFYSNKDIFRSYCPNIVSATKKIKIALKLICCFERNYLKVIYHMQ